MEVIVAGKIDSKEIMKMVERVVYGGEISCKDNKVFLDTDDINDLLMKHINEGDKVRIIVDINTHNVIKESFKLDKFKEPYISETIIWCCKTESMIKVVVELNPLKVFYLVGRTCNDGTGFAVKPYIYSDLQDATKKYRELVGGEVKELKEFSALKRGDRVRIIYADGIHFRDATVEHYDDGDFVDIIFDGKNGAVSIELDKILKIENISDRI